MVLGKITNEIINKLIIELKKKETKLKLQNEIIDPIIFYIIDKLYPYIFITSTIFILTFILAIIIFILLLRK